MINSQFASGNLQIRGTVRVVAFLISLLSANCWPQEQDVAIVPPITQVPAASYVYWPYDIKTDSQKGRIKGKAVETGGHNLRLIVMTKNQFDAWRTGRETQYLYVSNLRPSVVLDVSVTPFDTYYVVFDNTFSALSGKHVSADIRFIPEGTDIARAKKTEKMAKERAERAGQILGKLLSAFQATGRNEGAGQISPPIYFNVSRDPALDSIAIMQSKLIILSRGTVEFAESLPVQEGDNVLAGVLAHELAHLFYRHSVADPARQGEEQTIAGGSEALMVHPMVGFIAAELAWDRRWAYETQDETDADPLAVDLTCAAGFEPAGFLNFISTTRKANSGQKGFLRSHPFPAQRMDNLRKEIAESCPRLQPSQEDLRRVRAPAD